MEEIARLPSYKCFLEEIKRIDVQLYKNKPGSKGQGKTRICFKESLCLCPHSSEKITWWGLELYSVKTLLKRWSYQYSPLYSHRETSPKKSLHREFYLSVNCKQNSLSHKRMTPKRKTFSASNAKIFCIYTFSLPLSSQKQHLLLSLSKNNNGSLCLFQTLSIQDHGATP